MYKPLNMCIKQSDKLKQLISEYPDYPIVVLCDSDIFSGDNMWVYATELSFTIGEILDCSQEINDEKVYSDRQEFEEDLTDILSDSENYDDLTDEEFDNLVKTKCAKYEPYWKKVIQIWVYD